MGAASAGAPTRTSLLLAVLAATASYGALIASGPLQQAMAASLDSRLWHRVRLRFARRLLAPPGIAHLEEDGLQDAIARGRGDGWNPLGLGDVSGQLGGIVSSALALVGALAILARFRLWAAIAVGGVWLVSRILTAVMRSHDLAVREAHEQEVQRSVYVERLLADLPAAKEVRLFGLQSLLVGRLRDLVHAFSEARVLGRRRWMPLDLVMVLVIATADALVVAALFNGIVSGALGPASLALYGQALLQAVAATGSITFGGWGVAYAREFVIPILDLDRRPELDDREGRGGGGLAEGPRRAVRLEGVGFRYPSRSEPVLEGLDLTLEAGRSTAIVGVNGAGKTTLIRLLTRMYEPGEGRITVDGADLRDLDPVSWRRQLAVLSQGYSRYQMTVLENIGFGAGERWRDRAAAERAAAGAGVLSLVRSMPEGWETVLSRLYPGGRDLSGGQWQRLALARALRAVEDGARVLILDEPTAELDVRAEAELFDRFLDLTRGLTTLLISHRFSTVRRADEICVLDGGRITERGTHRRLLEAGGVYARMFTLQARHFQEDAGGADPASRLPGHVRSMIRISARAIRAEPVLVVASLTLTPLSGLGGPIAALWLRALADAALDRAAPPAVSAAIGLVATLAAAELLTVLRLRLQRDLQDRLASTMQPWFTAAAAGISGIDHLERPAYVDRLEVVRDNSWYLCWSFETFAEVLTVVLQLAVTVALLARVEPLLLLFALLGLPAGAAARASAGAVDRATEAMAGRERGVRHLLGLITRPEPAAEVRVFGLSGEMTGRIGELHREHDRGILRAVWGGALLQAAAALLLAAGYAGALAVVGLSVLAHRAPAGDLLLTALLLASLNGVVVNASAVLASWLRMMQGAVRRMVWLDDRLLEDRARCSVAGGAPDGGVIRLEGVSFAYPGADRLVLEEIDLELRPGRIVALVGDNGAGKTSLAKLLLRLYEPTSGRITVAGTPLDGIDPERWRRRCSGAFQDVVRFETSLGERRSPSAGWSRRRGRGSCSPPWSGRAPPTWHRTRRQGWAPSSARAGRAASTSPEVSGRSWAWPGACSAPTPPS